MIRLGKTEAHLSRPEADAAGVVGQPHRLPCPAGDTPATTGAIAGSCRGARVGRNKSLQATRLPLPALLQEAVEASVSGAEIASLCRRHACRYRPLEAINDYALTLVRPIPCIINQPCPNGIVANVEPFFAIAFLTPQDMIEKARLP